MSQTAINTLIQTVISSITAEDINTATEKSSELFFMGPPPRPLRMIAFEDQ